MHRSWAAPVAGAPFRNLPAAGGGRGRIPV